MRPKAHLQQKPWPRKAFQYASYAFWPMLVLWVLASYPGGRQAAAGGQLQTELRPVGRDTKMAVSGADVLSAGAGDTGDGDEPGQAAAGDASAAGWDADGGGVLPASGDGGEEPGQGGEDGPLEPVATVGGTDASGRVYSSCTIYAVRNGSGQQAKFYYKFANVRLTKKTLYFFMPPGMKKPEELWVDFISGNATQPRPPTMVVIKGEVQRQKWFYLPIKYTQTPSNCAAWTNKPTYFLQVRYSYNIWHTWNEGLMGAFQTLREQGLLPLAQVDGEGNMREVTEGLSPRCPTIFDPELNATREEEGCAPRLGLVDGTRCDPKNQAWCRPGVVSYRRYDGPIILPYSAASVMNRWAQVYDAMTTDIRDFSLVDGHCFKALYLGKTNTLNYYQPINQTEAHNPFVPERVQAMAVFKEFVATAQREFVAGERTKNPAAADFAGYPNPKMERLRLGIGPEDIGLVDNIAPTEVPGLLREELPQLKEMWAKRRQEVAKIEAGLKGGQGLVDLQADGQQQRGGGEDGGGKAAAEEEGGGGGKAEKSGADAGDGGEGRKRRQLRDPARGREAPGEGRRRRLPRQRRALLEAAAAAGAEAAAAAAEAAAVAAGEPITVQHIHQVAEAADEPAAAAAAMVGGEEAAEAARDGAERAAALAAMPPIVKRSDEFLLEAPRPVVAYMSRNFFSRGVLNEHDILRYILSRYNVTLRVTTFEEPLLEAMELLRHADVVIGMHGAGWTNGMFVKHGAVALQMFPYGWRLPDNSTIRGYNYREIVLASECRYIEWVSQRWDYAFFRRIDFNKRVKMEYVLHPDPHGPHPVDGWPGNPWIYQNTYVDMAHFGPYIDAAMKVAGIQPVPNPIPVMLN